jgi:[acyl-carrier-protein] S-malonyltransferase
MVCALVFPGQGSQKVGMGLSLAENFAVARTLFAEVDEALGEKLSQLMTSGPESELTLTRNAQPALFAVSLAVMRVLESEKGLDVARDIHCVAGHSLGEYSALAAAGSFGVATAARLLRLRGEAMQSAVPIGAGAMAAILGLELAEVERTCADAAAQAGGVCQAANDNGGGQVVISGTAATISLACELLRAAGAKRTLPLPVSAPFHCLLMEPAAARMRAALAETTIKAPCVPLIANVVARPLQDPEAIRTRLVEQVTATVRWRESVAYMVQDGVDRFLELGSGKVLCGLIKRIAADADCRALGNAEDVAGLGSAFALAQRAVDV